MSFLLGALEKLPNGCRLRRFAEPCGNILLAFPCQLCIVVLPICLLQSCGGCRSGIGAYLLLIFCFCLTLQLLVLLKGFIQLSRILFLLLIQLVQAGLHGGDFDLYRLDASVIRTAEIQQKVFFFGTQLFDFFCECRSYSFSFLVSKKRPSGTKVILNGRRVGIALLVGDGAGTR